MSPQLAATAPSLGEPCSRPEGAVSDPSGVALGLHKGILDPRTGCLRWPEHQRLLNERTGEVVLGRCKATNLCRYCQMLFVVETVEMLSIDAAEYAPELYAVLTAREHLTRAQTYQHLKQLRLACRRRWPDIEWFVQVEFQRRGALHLNLLIKGVPIDQAADLEQLLGERWCSRVDAEMPHAVKVKPIKHADGGADGVIRYLNKTLAHGLKAEQAPPIGWRGHRTSQTRGYLVRPASVMRDEARSSLRFKRELRKALQAGYEGHELELVAHEAIEEKRSDMWRLYAINFRRKARTTERARRDVAARTLRAP